MEKAVYTIGYESADVKDFIATLKNAGIEILIDVRALPQSRRPGFSKNAMKDALGHAGIGYLHLRGLGNPQKLGTAPDADSYHEMFELHMRSQPAQKDLKTACKTALEKTSCLLCYERKPEDCHRNIVVKHLTQHTGQNIHNLFIEKGGAVQSILNF